MTEFRIVHLIDDTTAGGVMRVLDYIKSNRQMNATATHEVVEMPRSRFSLRRIQADVIVSHLSISWKSLSTLVALRAAHADLPLLHVEHSYTQAFTALNVPHPKRFGALLRTAYALFDRVIAVSHAQGKWLTSRGLVSQHALRVIPSCVDLSPLFDITPVAGPAQTFGLIGRAHEQKGFDIAIRAFMATADADLRLRVFGEGGETDALRALCAGDSRITFHGHVDPTAAYSSVDAVLMPSRWEAFGLVALEARAAGRPIYCSRVDGLLDQIQHGAIGVQDQSLTAWSRVIRAASTTIPVGLESTRDAVSRSDSAFAASWSMLLDELFAHESQEVFC